MKSSMKLTFFQDRSNRREWNYNCKNEKIFFELEIKAGEDKSCLKLMNENVWWKVSKCKN